MITFFKILAILTRSTAHPFKYWARTIWFYNGASFRDMIHQEYLAYLFAKENELRN